MSQTMTNQNYRITDGERVSDAVVRATANVEGVEPNELGTKLYDVLDPDALDRLFRDDGRSPAGCVRFTYCDYEISVHADGRLHLTDV